MTVSAEADGENSESVSFLTGTEVANVDFQIEGRFYYCIQSC